MVFSIFFVHPCYPSFEVKILFTDVRDENGDPLRCPTRYIRTGFPNSIIAAVADRSIASNLNTNEILKKASELYVDYVIGGEVVSFTHETRTVGGAPPHIYAAARINIVVVNPYNGSLVINDELHNEELYREDIFLSVPLSVIKRELIDKTLREIGKFGGKIIADKLQTEASLLNQNHSANYGYSDEFIKTGESELSLSVKNLSNKICDSEDERKDIFKRIIQADLKDRKCNARSIRKTVGTDSDSWLKIGEILDLKNAIPLMPEFEPVDSLQAMSEVVKLNPGATIKVKDINIKGAIVKIPWYYVDVYFGNALIRSGWINNSVLLNHKRRVLDYVLPPTPKPGDWGNGYNVQQVANDYCLSTGQLNELVREGNAKGWPTINKIK